MNQPSPDSEYLAQLGPGSRRTMAQALGVIQRLLVPEHQAGADFDWTKVDRDAVARVRRELAEAYAPTTANKMLAALRGVLRVSRNQGLISERQYQAATGFDRVKDPRKTETRLLGDNELQALYDACDRDGTAAGRRDAALITIYLAAGLRREEATALQVEDFDEAAAELVIHSDIAERRRRVPLSAGAAARLRHWLDARGDDPGPLLLPVNKAGTIRPHPCPRKLTAQSLYAAVARVAERAEVGGVTPRDLRQTCLVQMLRTGLDADTLRQRVGHLSWLTTAAHHQLAAEAGDQKPWHIPSPASPGSACTDSITLKE